MHSGLAVDLTSGPGGGTVYVAWRTRIGLAFSRSVDGGRHFSTPRTIVPGEEIYVPVVASGPRGTVDVAYELIASDVAAYVAVVSSADHGRHFGRPVVVGSMTDTLMPAPGIRLPTGPSIAADPRDGTNYVTYVDDHAGGATILIARSHDGARTWSVPVRIPAIPQAHGTVPFQPHIAVDGSSDIDVTYLALAHERVTAALTRSTARGAGAWSTQQISDRSFDPTLGVISAGKGAQGSSWWIGDYQGLAVGAGLIHPFWNDTRTGRLEIFTAAVPEIVTR